MEKHLSAKLQRENLEKSRFFGLSVYFSWVMKGYGAWIARDTKVILEEAMKGNADVKHMDSSVFKNINPVKRGMTAEDFTYNEGFHHIGAVFPLHFFFVSKAFVTHAYDDIEFGFREPVNLTLKLKSGKWYATKVSIQP